MNTAALLRSPRWIALTLVAVVASGVFLFAAWWQGTRTVDIVAAEEASLALPVPVRDVADTEMPNASIGRPVLVTGAYAPEGQRLVSARELDGRPGLWVVTPLAVDGLWVPVIRGWVDSPDSEAVAVPVGEVTVTGVLQPYEEFYPATPVLPDGTLLVISPTSLGWSAPTLGGVVVLRSQRPSSEQAPLPVPQTVTTAGVGFPLQNAAYTLQWIMFAGVVWFIWLRWLRLDLRVPDDADNLAT